MRSFISILPPSSQYRKKFFGRAGDIYLTPHQVEISWLWNDGIYVAAGWPGFTHKMVSLEIGIELENYIALTKCFGAMSPTKPVIDEVTPTMLWQLYQAGKAEALCYIDKTGNYSLSFKQTQQTVTATDEWNNGHIVHTTLTTPYQFINYTKRYYQIRD